MSVPVELDDRLRVIEERIRNLVDHVEPLFDIRSAVESASGADLDAMLARVQALGAELKERENSGEWDATDQLVARLMLLTLAHVAVELRRRLNEGATLMASGRKRLDELQRAFAAFERELSPRNLDEQSES